MRIYENRNTRTRMNVHLGFAVDAVEECDLLEQPLRQADFEEYGFRDFIMPYEIKTYRLRIRKE